AVQIRLNPITMPLDSRVARPTYADNSDNNIVSIPAGSAARQPLSIVMRTATTFVNYFRTHRTPSDLLDRASKGLSSAELHIALPWVQSATGARRFQWPLSRTTEAAPAARATLRSPHAVVTASNKSCQISRPELATRERLLTGRLS